MHPRPRSEPPPHQSPQVQVWRVSRAPWGRQPPSTLSAAGPEGGWRALPGKGQALGSRTFSRVSVPRAETTRATRWWWTAGSTTSTCCPAASSTPRPCPSSVSVRRAQPPAWGPECAGKMGPGCHVGLGQTERGRREARPGRRDQHVCDCGHERERLHACTCVSASKCAVWMGTCTCAGKRVCAFVEAQPPHHPLPAARLALRAGTFAALPGLWGLLLCVSLSLSASLSLPSQPLGWTACPALSS